MLAADTARPKLDAPFSVTLSIRVVGNAGPLQNVYLPTFIGPEELGDVREQSSGPSGTLYRETLRLVAHTRGPLTITPGYLDAIDARDGKPKRFLSNDLHLNVEAGPPVSQLLFARSLEWAIGAIALLAALVLLRRRFAPAAVQIARDEPPAPAPFLPAAPSELDDALSQLRARRDRQSVMRVRRALWRIAGADDGCTLNDVLRKPQAIDAHLRRLLVGIERAAFVEDGRLGAAIDFVLDERTMTPA